MSEETVPPLPPLECPKDSTNAVDLATMLLLLKTYPKFARFIRRQLRLAFDDDKDAQDCLANICLPKGDELQDLGYSPSELDKVGKCTDHGRLIAIVAHGYI
jgi:hypothetical protein